jgi:hypothetical protein
MVCSALQNFSTFSYKHQDFQKKFLNIRCVIHFSLQHFSAIVFILKRTERYMVINAFWFSCKEPITLIRCSWNLNFIDRFSNIQKYIKVHENPFSVIRVVPCGRTDREPDMTKLPALHNFSKSVKNCLI